MIPMMGIVMECEDDHILGRINMKFRLGFASYYMLCEGD